MKTQYFVFSVITLFIILLISGCADNKVQSYYEKPLEAEKLVNPHFINLKWIDYLHNHKPSEQSADWIKWYLAHLNYPDDYDLTGTIYNYVIDSKGTWISKGIYNAADSYAASFLILLRDFLHKGGKIQLSDDDLARIDDIAWLILILQNPDGTIRYKSDSNVCFLMNNCEVWAGIMAYNDLAQILQLKKKEQFETAGLDLYNAINTVWKNGNQYYWAVTEDEKMSIDSKKFYPDRFSQLYPIAWGLLDSSPIIRKQLWSRFSLANESQKEALSDEQQLVYKWAEEAAK
jgi:hypothetical protein